MEADGIASRLKQLINFLELSDSQFADRCGISRATLSLLLSGKNKKISDVILSQIHEAFPQVSILWLLFKEGNITIPSNDKGLPSQNGVDANLFTSDFEKSNLDINTPYLYNEIDYNENLFSVNHDSGDEKNSNLTGLNIIEKKIQEAVSKGFERYFKNYISHNESDELAEKGKKIRQITVYYDDSTFETFSPGH